VPYAPQYRSKSLIPLALVVPNDKDGLALDLSQANGPGDRMVLVATEALTRNESWQPFAAGEMQVFAGGVPVWRRARHARITAVAMAPLGAHPVPVAAA
jgi:hypothetical protein